MCGQGIATYVTKEQADYVESLLEGWSLRDVALRQLFSHLAGRVN